MTAFRGAMAAGVLAVLFVASAVAQPGGREREPGRGADVRGVVKAVDAAKGTIVVAIPEGRQPAGGGGEKTFTLAKDAEIAVDNGRRAVFTAGTLADLIAGTPVALTLSADQKEVVAVLAEGGLVRGIVKMVDGQARTLTISLPAGRGEEGAAEKTFAVPPAAEIGVDTGRGGTFSVKPVKLSDLAGGAVVTLRVSANQKQAFTIVAEGPSLTGIVKAVDAGKSAITLTLVAGRGADAGEEKTVDVEADAVLLLDDGIGRRLGVREVKLADVPVGSVAHVKLSADQRTVTMLRAEGPVLFGTLKAVDAAKGTITVTIRKSREDTEDKTLPVAKGVRILFDGVETKLADLKAGGDDGPPAQIRLSLDQKTIQSVTTGTRRER